MTEFPENLDVWTNNVWKRKDEMWHLDEWFLTCGRKLNDKWRTTLDVWTSDACYVVDERLTHGRMLHDMWKNDLWCVDEWYLMCGAKAFDTCMSDIWYVDEWYLMGRRMIFDRWANDICLWTNDDWYVDEWCLPARWVGWYDILCMLYHFLQVSMLKKQYLLKG